MLKKSVCISLRHLISEAARCEGTSSSLPSGVGKATHPNSRGAAPKATTRLNVSYFSEVLDSLNKKKRGVIESYGFGSLLHFDKCAIPIPFARWVVDHISVSSGDIVLKNKSIPITPQTVHDVLGIPIGGKTISKASQECGKFAFLRCMNMSNLPSVNVCRENLLKKNISDDDLVRNFLIVALATFLCPNSCVFPSTEYLKPLVDIKRAQEWDWCKFVHYWMFKHIKLYNQRLKKEEDKASTTMGECLYIVCVVYLDFLNTGLQQLPPSLPRISVWKGT